MATQTLPHGYRRPLRSLFDTALEAVDPAAAVYAHLQCSSAGILTAGRQRYDLANFDRIVVLGAGKAGYPMARACEDIFGPRLSEGLVIVKEGHGGPLERVAIVEGTHPLPSERNKVATERLLAMAQRCDERTLVILLISGGGSALLPAPVEGSTLTDKLEATKVLLGCGATISEVNCIRKHLSRIKGGGLARILAPATTVVAILSDVIGDHLDAIASGPVAADTTSFSDACAIIERYRVEEALPPAVVTHLKAGRAGLRPETLAADDPALARVHPLLVGTNRSALTALQEQAKTMGFTVEFLSATIEGEARELAKFYGAIARERARRRRRKPLLVVGGGETTVTIRGRGTGGRNQEFALACALEIAGLDGAFAAGFATDGTDGPTNAAGAFADATTVERGQRAGLSAAASLDDNDSHGFFSRLDDLIVTGPTGTNVCDIYVVGLQ